MLADKLYSCKEQENVYVDRNIKEIQELYKAVKDRRRGKEKKYRMRKKYFYTNYTRNLQDQRYQNQHLSKTRSTI